MQYYICKCSFWWISINIFWKRQGLQNLINRWYFRHFAQENFAMRPSSRKIWNLLSSGELSKNLERALYQNLSCSAQVYGQKIPRLVQNERKIDFRHDLIHKWEVHNQSPNILPQLLYHCRFHLRSYNDCCIVEAPRKHIVISLYFQSLV